MTRTELYPEVEPYDSGTIDVGGGHEMYWEVCGNPEGAPALFLHGGPGAGATRIHRRFFDPEHYRIVIFDQRGAGRSKPLGGLRDNTTPHLIADIERLRESLDIKRWLIFGGSWGSTLALAYGIDHPERCNGFVLRGIFLCREVEIDWFLHGMRTVFPEAWAKFASFLPEDERGALLANYHRRLTDPDRDTHMPAARAWSTYEGACSTLLPSPETVAAFNEDQVALGLARIEAHYFKHHIFLPEDHLMAHVGTLRHIPCTIVQGRYDMVCPIVTADQLTKAWPEADYIIVPDAGHSAMEPGIREALISATERFKSLA